mgnify:CR=1 FL=1
MEFSKDLHRAKAHYDELYSAYRTVAHVLNNIPEDDHYWDYLRQVKVRLGNAAEEFKGNIGQGLSGAQDGENAQYDEHDRNDIIADDFAPVLLSHETHLPTS